VTPRIRPSTPGQMAAANVQELRAGRPPLRAQPRLTGQRRRARTGEPGAFTSDLGVDEFAAIRSVGFSPVGQVFGTAVYTVGWLGSSCGVPWYAKNVPARVLPARPMQQTLSEARARAVDRMRYECEQLGADGVVGVRFQIRLFFEIGLEFLAIGTAVRADARGPRPGTPFSSDLNGQDFAKLLRAGWVPVAFVQGVGVTIRHVDYDMRMQGRSWVNTEMTGPTELVQAARETARKDLRAQARRVGATGVVLRDMTSQQFERECVNGIEGFDDRIAEVIMTGTAIVPYGRKPHTTQAPLTMLRLNSQRKATNDGRR
jgi:uncharacterized protein YbjQ (UPF0145 family)